MEHLEIYENYNNRIITLEAPSRRTIKFIIEGGKIKNIENPFDLRFPYKEGENYTRSIEIWACNNNFTMNGKDMCGEPKIFGIKQNDIPKGHELRTLFPNKFKKGR